jgi:hypothetical protein
MTAYDPKRTLDFEAFDQDQIQSRGTSAEEEETYLSVVVKAFHELGYSDGKNIRLENRFPARAPTAFGHWRENWST